MIGIRIGRYAPTALIIFTSCLFAPAIAQSAAASGEGREPANKIAEKPSNIVTTPTGPRQFGRDSVYATEPPSPRNPVLAGGLTVDEAGGAPLYAVQLTHPSGPVMEGRTDLQPYGRDSVYVAEWPNAAPVSYPVGRYHSRIDALEISRSSVPSANTDSILELAKKQGLLIPVSGRLLWRTPMVSASNVGLPLSPSRSVLRDGERSAHRAGSIPGRESETI